MIDNQLKLNIRRQCNPLSKPSSGLYYKPKGEKTENLEIMRLIVSLQPPTYCKRKNFSQAGISQMHA